MMKKKGARTENKDVKRQRKMMKRNGGESQSLKAMTQTRASFGMNLKKTTTQLKSWKSAVFPSILGRINLEE